MTDLPEIRGKLLTAIKEKNIQIVADELNMHYNTVRKIALGIQKNPRYETLKTIESWLVKNGR